jgi:hypothetical protein
MLSCLAVLILIGCGEEPGRVRASKAELVGVYETQFGDGEEKLELRSDQTYVQDFTWQGRPIHQMGTWNLENLFLDGSNVVLISSVVSVPGPDGRIGQLAINETADWYFEPVK